MPYLVSRKCWRSAGRTAASSCQVRSFRRGGEGGGVDCGQDGVPDFDEVVAAGVGEDAEGGVGGVGGEDVADELIAGDAGLGAVGRLRKESSGKSGSGSETCGSHSSR